MMASPEEPWYKHVVPYFRELWGGWVQGLLLTLLAFVLWLFDVVFPLLFNRHPVFSSNLKLVVSIVAFVIANFLIYVRSRPTHPDVELKAEEVSFGAKSWNPEGPASELRFLVTLIFCNRGSEQVNIRSIDVEESSWNLEFLERTRKYFPGVDKLPTVLTPGWTTDIKYYMGVSPTVTGYHELLRKVLSQREYTFTLVYNYESLTGESYQGSATVNGSFETFRKQLQEKIGAH